MGFWQEDHRGEVLLSLHDFWGHLRATGVSTGGADLEHFVKMISARFISHEASLLPAVLSSLEMSHRVQPTLKGRGMKLHVLGGACVRRNSAEELRAFLHIYSSRQLFIRDKGTHGFSGSQFKAIIQASASELALVFLCP